jgi:PAS domain S-box-containing protein
MSSPFDVPDDKAPDAAGADGGPGLREELRSARERIRELERDLAVQRQELRASETTLDVINRYHEDVSSAISDVLLVVDSEGCILSANRAALGLLGYEEHELLGARLGVLAPDLTDRALDELTCDGPGARHIDTTLRSEQDQRIPVLMRVSTLEDSLGGEVYVCVAIDMRERLRLEQELNHAQRLESVGQLSASIAHEINNPLGYIVGNLEYVRDELADSSMGDTSELLMALDQAAEGALRVRDVVRDLLAFSRIDQDELEAVDVQLVLESTLRLAMGQIKRKARVIRDYVDVPRVWANRLRLGQVALNLVINAVQALPDDRAEDNVIRLSTGRDQHGRVVFEVHDNGPGIPEHIRTRLFEPFFSTKPAGLGTGLGLSICHNIIGRFRGEISVQSEPGQGAAFRVHLPVAMAVAMAESPAESLAESPAESLDR